jgi:hypothetical protein
VLAGAACLLATAAGCSDDEPPAATPSDPTPSTSPTQDPPPDGDLPRGGRSIFPEHQLVGFVGYPGSKALGPLHADLDQQAARLEKLAPSYAAGRTPLPVFELIVVLVQAKPGRDGMYRSWLSDAEIERYLETARKHRMLLLLDVQPGRSDPLTEIKRLEKWLVEPDVGLAFDPEWAVGKGQVPGRVFGRTTGAELDRIAAYLSGLVRRHHLPEKVFVFHQLAARIVRDEQQLRPHPGVVTIKSVDGIGGARNKISTWRKLTPRMAPGVHAGFKLFYDEDTRHGPLMTPRQVLSLRPRPEFVVYE